MVPQGFAHYRRNKYPIQLVDLIPKYLPIRKEDIPLLDIVSYTPDPSLGYRLSLAKPRPGDMNVIISPKGVRYESLPGGGS
jgi:hypothetical protein